MKRIVIVAAAVLFTASVVGGQPKYSEKEHVKGTTKEVKTTGPKLKKLEGNTVSPSAKTGFAADFGNVSNVEWRRGLMFDEATFTKGAKKMTAYYDSEGKLVGTTEAKTIDELPAKAKQEIKAKYKDYKVGKVIFFYDSQANETDMYLYGTQFADEDNYFAELSKGPEKLIVKIDVKGDVSYFAKL